jgi:hypothetical protein
MENADSSQHTKYRIHQTLGSQSRPRAGNVWNEGGQQMKRGWAGAGKTRELSQQLADRCGLAARQQTGGTKKQKTRSGVTCELPSVDVCTHRYRRGERDEESKWEKKRRGGETREWRRV